jgi:Transglycosylase SLT domain
MCMHSSKQRYEQQSSVSLPSWLSSSMQSNAERANALAQTPTQAFTGPSYTPITAAQTNAMNATAGITGFAPSQVSAGSLGSTDLSPYLNPFTQDVIDTTGADIDRSTAIAQEQAKGNAAAVGAFGGDRQGIQQAEIAGQGIRTKANVGAQLRAQNFGQAQAAATGDINRALTADTQNQMAGIQGAGLDLSAASQLFGQGETEREAQDQGRQFDYAEFLRQQADPYNKLSWAQGVTTGAAPYFSTQNTTGYSPGPSSGSQILGGITSGIGALGKSGAFGPAGWLIGTGVDAAGQMATNRATGGRIGYAAGGDVDAPSDLVRHMRRLAAGGEVNDSRPDVSGMGITLDPEPEAPRPVQLAELTIDRSDLPRGIKPVVADRIMSLSPYIAAAADKYGVPPRVVTAIVNGESGGRSEVVGDQGHRNGASRGVMQVQEATARNPGFGIAGIDPAALHDPATNIDFATHLLAEKARKAGVDWNNPDHLVRGIALHNGSGPMAEAYGRRVAATIPGRQFADSGRIMSDAPAPRPGDPVAVELPRSPAAAGITGAPAEGMRGDPFARELNRTPRETPRRALGDPENSLWDFLLTAGGAALASRSPGGAGIGEGIVMGSRAAAANLNAQQARHDRKISTLIAQSNQWQNQEANRQNQEELRGYRRETLAQRKAEEDRQAEQRDAALKAQEQAHREALAQRRAEQDAVEKRERTEADARIAASRTPLSKLQDERADLVRRMNALPEDAPERKDLAERVQQYDAKIGQEAGGTQNLSIAQRAQLRAKAVTAARSEAQKEGFEPGPDTDAWVRNRTNQLFGEYSGAAGITPAEVSAETGPLPEPQRRAPPLPAGALENLNKNASSLSEINAAIEQQQKIVDSLNSGRGSKSGTGAGMQYVPNSVAQIVNPAGNQSRALVARVSAQKIHDLTGAAQTVAEVERLKPYLPQVSDDAVTVLEKMKELRDAYKRELRTRVATFGRYDIPVPTRKMIEGEPEVSGAAANSDRQPQTPQADIRARGNQALSAARAELGNGASDDEILKRAKEIMSRGQ